MAKCEHYESEVVETRTRDDGQRYRRRHCKTCMAQFSTVEISLNKVRDMEDELNQLRAWRQALRDLLK